MRYPNTDHLIRDSPCQMTAAAPTAPTQCFSWSSQIPPREAQTRAPPAHGLCSHLTACPQPARLTQPSALVLQCLLGTGRACTPGAFTPATHLLATSQNSTAKLSPVTTWCQPPLLLPHPQKLTERTSLCFSAGKYPLNSSAFQL